MTLAEPQVQSPRTVEAAFNSGVTGAVFSDAGLLAATLGDGSVQLIGRDDYVMSVHVHDGAALCLAVDIDGHGFVSGGDDGRLVRTAADGVVTELMNAPNRQVDVLAVSRSGGFRAAAVGREVRLLNSQGTLQARAADHPSTIAGLAFNAKGKRLAVAHYGGVTLWWTATLGETAKRLGWRGSHIGVSWSPDGSHVMTATQECELHGWQVADGADLTMRGYATKVRSMDWQAKPPVLVTAGADCVVAWSFAGTGPQGKPPLEVGQKIGRLVTRVAVHPTGKLVAAGFDDGQVALCELNPDGKSRTIRLRSLGSGRVSALTWSLDGVRLAAGTDRGVLYVYDLGKRTA